MVVRAQKGFPKACVGKCLNKAWSCSNTKKILESFICSFGNKLSMCKVN